MRSLIKLTGRSGSSEIGLDALAQIRARAESGGGLSKSGWLVDTTKDWFCGTKLRDAKTCLYKLVALETSDNERLQQFSRLKGLISDGYRDRLVEIETADGFALAIAINAIDGNYLGFLTLYDFSDPATVCNLDHIQRRIDDVVQSAQQGENAHRDLGDFVRGAADAVYVLEGTCYTFCGDQSTITRAWDATKLLVEKLGCSEEQLTSIFALAHRRMFSIVKEAALEMNGGLLTENETEYHKGPPDQLRYSLRRVGEYLELTGFSSLLPEQDTGRKSLLERPVRLNLAPDPVESFVLKIAPDGSARIVSALFGNQP